MKFLIIKLILCVVTLSAQAKIGGQSDLSFDINNKTTLNYIIYNQIKDQYQYSGLATYLNQVQYNIVDEDNIYSLDRNSQEPITLDANQWLAIAGRFDVLLIKSANSTLSFNNEQLSIHTNGQKYESTIVSKTNLAEFSAELDQIRYNHLWKPFAIIAKASESLLMMIKDITSLSWGLVILLFAVVIKLLLMPLTIITEKSQQNVSKITSKLQPRLAEIKRKYDGEKAHNMLMKAYKDLGVSPFYTLKPMLIFLIQIPILIAIFNSLGEMPQLIGQSFLWFSDLSQPDMLLPLGLSIPLLGEHINLMPIIMTFITLTSTILHKDKHASTTENKKQKIKLYLMSAAFLILFYPFPAAMVMYWAMANLLGFVQQKVLS